MHALCSLQFFRLTANSLKDRISDFSGKVHRGFSIHMFQNTGSLLDDFLDQVGGFDQSGKPRSLVPVIRTNFLNLSMQTLPL